MLSYSMIWICKKNKCRVASIGSTPSKGNILVRSFSLCCKCNSDDFTELKEKYVSSGQQRDKLSENAQSLRIKADSLEMQKKDAIAEASESRRALDEFKAGIDKVSADMQFALVVSKAQLEEERKKNAILIRQARLLLSVIVIFHHDHDNLHQTQH
jgi:hypothetical protein